MSSVVAQSLGLVVTSIVGVLLVRLIATRSGKTVFGHYATATGFVLTFAILTDLGLTASTVRELARNPERAQEITANNLGLRLTMSAAFVPLMFALSFAFYPAASFDLHLMVLLTACFLPFDTLRQVLNAQFSAQGRNVFIAFVTAFQQVALLGLGAIAVFTLPEPFLAVAFATSGILGFLLIAAVTRRSLSLRPRCDLSAWRAILISSLSVGLVQVASLLYQRIDGVLVSVIAGTTAAGTYAAAYLVVTAVASMPGFVMTPLLPQMSRSTSGSAARTASAAISRICVLEGALAAAVIVSANDIVNVVAGPKFTAAVAPLRILAGATVLIGCTTAMGYLTVSLDRQRAIVKLQIVCLLANIGVNCVMIPTLGLVGAAVTTAITEVVLVTGLRRLLLHQFGLRVTVFGSVFRTAVFVALSVVAAQFAVPDDLTSVPLVDGAARGASALALFLSLCAVSAVIGGRRGGRANHVAGARSSESAKRRPERGEQAARRARTSS